MDAQSSVYSEKKLATYETIYKESVISKPQEISLTITAAHIYGLAYICDQIGTKEEDPVYTRFTCSIDEITKVYINTNNKNSPIYIQCDEEVKNAMNRRRIILPCFGAKNDEIVTAISNLVAEHEQKKKLSEEKKYKDYSKIKKAMDDEFNSMTSGYKKPALAKKAEEKIDTEMIFEEIRKPIQKTEFTSESIVNDMLGIDEILTEIKSSSITSQANAFEFEAIDNEPDEDELESIPVEVFQKNPAEIEELVVPVINSDFEIADIHSDKPAFKPAAIEIEEVDTEKIIQQKLAEKLKKAEPEAEPVKAEVVEEKPAPVPEVKQTAVIEKASVNSSALTLDEFEDAVKKLKIMLDNGAITENEFAIEKKKLLSTLY